MLNLKWSLALILGLLTLSLAPKAAERPNRHNSATLVGQTFLARVMSAKAIVYTDENMLSPLGHITAGKIITVGNPRKINPALVPLVVHGRLAFIEIKDIHYEDAKDISSAHLGPPSEHNFDITLERPMEDFTKNNSFYASLHRFGAGEETKNAFWQIDNSDQDAFVGFQLQLLHRPVDTHYFWGVLFEYNSATTSTVQFNYYMMGPTFGYQLPTPMDDLFLLDLYGSLNISTRTEFEIQNSTEPVPNSVVWGLEGNARLNFFPESKYHLTTGLGFRRFTVTKLSPLKDVRGQEIDGIKTITGLALFVGFGMELR